MDEYDRKLQGLRDRLASLGSALKNVVRELDLLECPPTPTPGPPQEFGEPWEIYDAQDSWRARDDALLTFLRAYDKERLKRAVACVNALAGIANPAAVGPLLRCLRANVRHNFGGSAEVVVAGTYLVKLVADLDKAPNGSKVSSG